MRARSKPPREQGLRWLNQARADLHWAEYLATQGGYYLACFLGQQVAEKALKGYLYAQGAEAVLTNSVERLCAAAARFNESFRAHGRRWSILDGYYIPTRYPNGLPDGIPADVYTEAAAKEAVRLAQEVVETVSGLLEPK